MRLVGWRQQDVSSQLTRLENSVLIVLELHPTYPQYLWYPEVLANASHSAEYLAIDLIRHIASSESTKASHDDLRDYIRKSLVQDGLGISEPTDEEIQLLLDQPIRSAGTFAEMISRRAQIGWSTHGHSAVDVNVYGSEGTEVLRGNHENTEIGEFLRNYLGVDVSAITKQLRQKSQTFAPLAESRQSWPSTGHPESTDHYHRTTE